VVRELLAIGGHMDILSKVLKRSVLVNISKMTCQVANNDATLFRIKYFNVLLC